MQFYSGVQWIKVYILHCQCKLPWKEAGVALPLLGVPMPLPAGLGCPSESTPPTGTALGGRVALGLIGVEEKSGTGCWLTLVMGRAGF